MKKLFIYLVLSILAFNLSYSGNKANEQKANELLAEAIEMMNKGNFKNPIELLDSAIALDRKPIKFPYEKAVCYFKLSEWQMAAHLFDSLRNHPQVNDQVYQMLGNCYSFTSEYTKALDVLNEGIKKFPNSGRIFFGLGIAEFGLSNYENMLYYWYQGIHIEPSYSMTYYHLGDYYYNSEQKIWAIIYFEYFMNLTTNIRKMYETSKNLFDSYRKVFYNASGYSQGINFIGTINTDSTKKLERYEFMKAFQDVTDSIRNPKLPQEQNELKIIEVTNYRGDFLKIWYKNKLNEKFHEPLLDYQKKIMDLGMFTEYNFWIFKEANPTEYNEWIKTNFTQFKKFITWQKNNKFDTMLSTKSVNQE
jgi:tetratricopeptide (TPR) repeat protein